MSANPKRIPVRIINAPEGFRDITSLAHARRYVSRGVARFTATGSLEFIHRRQSAAAQSPNVDIAAFRPCDSGVSGFNRYPMPSQVSIGPRFSALSRDGAGLAA